MPGTVAIRQDHHQVVTNRSGTASESEHSLRTTSLPSRGGPAAESTLSGHQTVLWVRLSEGGSTHERIGRRAYSLWIRGASMYVTWPWPSAKLK